MSILGRKMLRIIGTISILSMSIIVGVNLIVFQFLSLKLQNEALNCVNTTLSSINGDKLEKTITSKSMQSQEYKEIEEAMMKAKSDKNLSFFYTLALGDNNNTYFIVDSAITEKSKLGEKYILNDEMKQAFNGQPATTKKPVKDSFGTFISAYAPIKNSAGKIIAIAAVDKDIEAFVSIKNTLLISIGGAAAVLIILSFIATYLFSRKLSSNVTSIRTALMHMTDGDLTVKLNIKSKDEFELIANDLNKFAKNCGTSVKLIKDECNVVLESAETLSAISEEMAASSEVVAASVNDVAKSTFEQSNEINSINNSLKVFGDKIDETITSVNEVNSKIEFVNATALISNEDLTLLDESIKDIVSSFNNVSEKINGLSLNLAKINEITNLINGIADQTNLLALNAAIEAARAGESGRGFSVVADEIRKLAEQSKESSEGINSLIKNITVENSLVVSTSGEMSNKLIKQIEVVDNSTNSFKEIILNIEAVSKMINIVNTNIDSLKGEKENIISSLESITNMSAEISTITEEISASSEELSTSSEDVANSSQNMRNKAENMIGSVNHFVV